MQNHSESIFDWFCEGFGWFCLVGAIFATLRWAKSVGKKFSSTKIKYFAKDKSCDQISAPYSQPARRYRFRKLCVFFQKKTHRLRMEWASPLLKLELRNNPKWGEYTPPLYDLSHFHEFLSDQPINWTAHRSGSSYRNLRCFCHSVIFSLTGLVRRSL